MEVCNQQKELELLKALRKLSFNESKTMSVSDFDALLPTLSKKTIQRLKTVLIKNNIIRVQCKGNKRGDWSIIYISTFDCNIHTCEQAFIQMKKLLATYKRNSRENKKRRATFTSDWVLEQIKNIKNTFESNNPTQAVDININFLSVVKHKI